MSGYDANLNGELPHPDSTAQLDISIISSMISGSYYASMNYWLISNSAAGYHGRRPSQGYSSLLGYNARRPSQNLMYPQYDFPGAAGPLLQQPSTAYDRQSDHMNQGTSALEQPRVTFEATTSTYDSLELHRTYLQASSTIPKSGIEGSQVHIDLKSSSDLQSPSPRNVTLMFAERTVPAALTFDRLESGEQNSYYNYSVSATVPAFFETGSSSLRIPLYLRVQGWSYLDHKLINAGEWLYEDGKQAEHRSPPQEASRKRRTTDTPSDTSRLAKRAAPLEQQTTQSQGGGSYLSPSAGQPAMDFPNMERRLTSYGRSQLQQSHLVSSNATQSQGPLGSGSSFQLVMRPFTGQTSTWDPPPYEAGLQSSRDSQPYASPPFSFSSMPSPNPANRIFLRANRLPHYIPSTGWPQAMLEIRGSLDSMQSNWTPGERVEQRRIVRFWREQSGPTIKTYFRPLRANERFSPYEANETRISCIHWKERKGQSYITSVETIVLLELLLGAGFYHDHKNKEKNRIRRNVQNFKPETVEKEKDEYVGFHKMIMDFTEPKPRSINKPIKVFRWETLGQCLKKVVSKHVCFISLIGDHPLTDLYQVAIPSGVLNPLEGRPDSNLSGSHSEASASRNSAVSSRSTPRSTSSSMRAPKLESGTLSPPTHLHDLPSHAQVSALHPSWSPSVTHSYNDPASSSQYLSDNSFDSPYSAQVSIPSTSSTYSTTTIGSRRASGANADDMLADIYHSSSSPYANNSIVGQYASEEPNGAPPLGLPRASFDASFNADIAHLHSMSIAQYRHQSSMNGGTVMPLKEE